MTANVPQQPRATFLSRAASCFSCLLVVAAAVIVIAVVGYFGNKYVANPVASYINSRIAAAPKVDVDTKPAASNNGVAGLPQQQNTVVPSASPAPSATTDPNPVDTAYKAILALTDRTDQLVATFLNPSVPPQKDQLIFTGHGHFIFGDKQITLPYYTPACDVATKCGRLYIIWLVNEADPGNVPINFYGDQFPSGGTSAWEFTQGAKFDPAPLWEQPLAKDRLNDCGYPCQEVVIIKMVGNSKVSGDSVTVTATIYYRDGTSEDFADDTVRKDEDPKMYVLQVKDGVRPPLPSFSTDVAPAPATPAP
ncbi:MAG TPA: hypothetical protein VLI92_03635 [Candidatus Saccharimonadales bacterium]|nr:hypothetical protein [Candidatus Saccharimonadales bacterium]